MDIDTKNCDKRQEAASSGAAPPGRAAPASAASAPPLASIIRLVLRSIPLCSGVGKIMNRIPRLGSLEPAEASIVARLRSGALIKISTRDLIGRQVYWTGDYDRKISWTCRRVLRRGDTALDIGANNGAVSLAAAGVVGPEGMIHAVEPQPDLAAALRESAALNAFSNLHIHEVALSDRDGTAVIHIPDNNSGEATLSESGEHRRGVEVTLRHAGDFFASLGPAPIRLVKIDVEDHEAEVLGAAKETLRRHPPDVIVFESHDHGTPFWEREAINTLARLGYRMHQIPKALLRMRVVFIPPGADPPCNGWDFVAVAPGPRRAEIERRLRARGGPRE